MDGFISGPIDGAATELSLAEQKSWQNYLAAVLHMNTTLNRQLTTAHQLSLADVQLLDLLANAPSGSIQMGQLAIALMSLPSRLTRQVRRLESDGLVERTTSPHDRRRVLATITGTGRTLMEEAMVTYANEVRTHFLGPLTRPQVAAVATTCRQIRDSLNGAEHPTVPKL
ncbi:MarR family winged helix-turn-helix transcriptional regulator [Mycolicibacter icosiumassiliensis]|uniref:MarR family winged helix-turn-helix transcriptional regulator n=1 Tax=Mycolicibacter icosiumassiliensis TaxID=1792835 RepID=UPI0008300220|nr:MarR family transcriptional regulator [Mycolicibacter icosiumassiliensis]